MQAVFKNKFSPNHQTLGCTQTPLREGRAARTAGPSCELLTPRVPNAQRLLGSIQTAGRRPRNAVQLLCCSVSDGFLLSNGHIFYARGARASRPLPSASRRRFPASETNSPMRCIRKHVASLLFHSLVGRSRPQTAKCGPALVLFCPNAVQLPCCCVCRFALKFGPRTTPPYRKIVGGIRRTMKNAG
jgi:hypothetical protein